MLKDFERYKHQPDKPNILSSPVLIPWLQSTSGATQDKLGGPGLQGHGSTPGKVSFTLP